MMKFQFVVLCVISTLGSTSAFVEQSVRSRSHYKSASPYFSKLPVEDEDDEQGDFDGGVARRVLFQKAAATTGAIVIGLPLFSSPANAATPVTVAEAENFSAKAQRLLRPKPPKALRPKLNLDFAVLLMRSSYNALDELDCVAMDQFQRDFFLIRQAEYEPYVNELGPGIVKQGDLTDPYYFDFISFAQYATINREVFQDPAVVFNEQKPIEVPEDQPQQFTSIVIKRDPALTNDKLAPTHSQIVGSTILNKIEETFGATDARIPKVAPGSRPSADTVLASVEQLVKLFLINGYAWEGKAFISKSGTDTSTGSAAGTQISIALTAPANVWSGQALQLRNKATLGGGVLNSFVLITTKELVSRMGYGIASTSVSYEGTKEISTLTLR